MSRFIPFTRALAKIALARSAYYLSPSARLARLCIFLSRSGSSRRNTRVRQEKGFWVRERVRALNGNCAGGCLGTRPKREILVQSARKQPFSRREFNLPPTVRAQRKCIAPEHTCIEAGLFHLSTPVVSLLPPGGGRIDGSATRDSSVMCEAATWFEF